MITDRNKQMERWVENYIKLYSSKNNIMSSTLNDIDSLPSMDKLDAEPTLCMLNKAINSLVSGKGPGNDGIPPFLIKYCRSTLICPLHEVLYQCWWHSSVPQDMCDAKIVNLYKNTGDKTDSNHDRCISPKHWWQALCMYHTWQTSENG